MDPDEQVEPNPPAESTVTPTEATPATLATDAKPVETPEKAYGKRPMWQWVLLYVVLAVVVYGVVYYFFMRDKGTASIY